MNFPFNINHLFGERITVVDRNLRPYRTHSHGHADHQANLQRVIDEMGKASSKAQGLNHVITTSHRLRFSDNRLYVMKDSEANGGNGLVVGILKTGKKNLFVLDRHGNQTEMQPVCVLDFYVHESCQRKGYGKMLFTHMLQAEGVKPQHLAIDRPSHKFLSFLTKHYNLRATIAQVNNFVIFEGFFTNQPDSSYCRRRGMGKPPVPPNHKMVQPSPPQPHRNATTAGVWATGSSPTTRRKEREVLREVRPGSRGSLSSGGSNDGAGLELTGLEISSRGMGAQANSYSRYAQSNTPPGRVDGGGRRGSLNRSPIVGSPAQGLVFGEQYRRNSWDSPQRETTPGTRTKTTGGNATPPFGHIGAFSSYNTHLQTQDRHGHLKVSPNSTRVADNNRQNKEITNNTASTTISNGQQAGPSGTTSLDPSGNYVISYTSPQSKVMHSSWNVMGIPPGGQTRGSPSQNSPLTGGSAYQSPSKQGRSPYRNQHWSSHGIF